MCSEFTSTEARFYEYDWNDDDQDWTTPVGWVDEAGVVVPVGGARAKDVDELAVDIWGDDPLPLAVSDDDTVVGAEAGEARVREDLLEGGRVPALTLPWPHPPSVEVARDAAQWRAVENLIRDKLKDASLRLFDGDTI
jgi:hypothetical protein